MPRRRRRMKRAICRPFAVGLLAWSGICCGTNLWADVRLPALISDHMVLQADRPDNVWGWADPDEEITVRIADQVRTARADADGHWTATLDKLPAGSGLTLVVEGHNRLEVTDVSIGEVWVCSGQSNMGVPVIRSTGARRPRQQPIFLRSVFSPSLPPARSTRPTTLAATGKFSLRRRSDFKPRSVSFSPVCCTKN